MLFLNSIVNFIKYVFFIQILYCSILIANEKDLRANPEVGLENNIKTSIAYSKNFMIACADKRAALAAKRILQKGGTAIDAAIAAQNVLSVVEPQSSGIGGGGFLIYYNSKLNSLEAWDGREFAPSNSKPNQFIDLQNKKIPFLKAVVSPSSIGVPGLYSMLADAHIVHGKTEWKNLFEDAVLYAESFKISPRLNKMLKWAPHIKNDIYARKIYFNDRKPKNIGTTVKNVELLESLKALSKNSYSVNRGEIAKLIDEKLSPVLTKKDLSSWKTIQRKTICKKYKGYDICGFPPPTSGGVGVLQILGILENIEINFDPLNTVLDEHLFLEAARLAYADRNIYIADPNFFEVPLKDLLSNKYLKKRSALIKIKKASKEIKHGNFHGFKGSSLSIGKNFDFPSTTHISIIDNNGNAAALTSSIEFAFGSGKTVGGFFLNNQLTDFSFASHNKNGDLIVNSVAAKKKPRSSMAPTLVFKDSKLVGVLGSPGGSRIICYVAQALYYLINFDMKLEKVMELPHLCSRGRTSEIEAVHTGDKISEQLNSMGHDITRNQMTSGLNIIWKGQNLWTGASDHRREGVAIGF